MKKENNPTMTIYIDGDNIGAFFECNGERIKWNELTRTEQMIWVLTMHEVWKSFSNIVKEE